MIYLYWPQALSWRPSTMRSQVGPGSRLILTLLCLRMSSFHFMATPNFLSLIIFVNYSPHFSRSLRQDPLDLSFWSFLTFLHHGIFCENFIKKFERKVGQMCHRSCSLALGFYTKLYTKSAVSESSIALARLNLTF